MDVKSKAVSVIALILLLMSNLISAFNIQPVKAIGIIYIKSDGSIDPLTAPIQRNGNIYTLTGNINSDTSGIWIERNNMILDGAGYTVQGTKSVYSFGVSLWKTSNVTIKNLKVRAFWEGISLFSSSNNNILTNEVIENDVYGILLVGYSNNNIILGNKIEKNIRGIELWGSGYPQLASNNSIYGNIIRNNTYGIYLLQCSNNKFYHNSFIENLKQLHIQQECYSSIWDNGYPYGGNYWSDYNGVDEKSGPNQDLPGSDDIGDTPYVIDENNIDHYPLIEPFENYFKPAAPKILPVPYYYQGDTPWCVPTSMSMIFKYYGQNIHSWDIAKDWGWGRDDYRVQPWTVSDCFKDYGLTTDVCIVTAFPPSFQSIRDWLDKRMPILLSMASIDHAVVIVGYDIIGDCEKVYINDPSSALINTEMGLSESYPYVAIEVNWNELASYINPLSYLIAVGGTPQPSKGTIDLFQTFNYKAVCFGHRYRGRWSGIYSWYASDRGLIWERSEDHALALNSRDQFQYRLCFANHMKDGQVYLFEIEFAKYDESISTWIPASVICLPISIDGYNSISKISHLISLGDLLKEYGEYKFTLRLWDNRAPELLWDEKLKYDEIVFPSFNYSPLIEFYLCSAADLYITDPQGLHVGVDPSIGEMVNEIPGAIYTGPGSDPQVIAIPGPLDGHYDVQLIGTSAGTYSLTMDFLTLQETLTQTYTSEIVEGAVYVYSITISDEGMTSNPKPVVELEHLKKFIMNLPDDVFISDDLDEFDEFKEEMFDKIDETLEELVENKCMDAIEKLKDMKEEIIVEKNLQPTTESDLCVIIDHVISNIEGEEEND